MFFIGYTAAHRGKPASWYLYQKCGEGTGSAVTICRSASLADVLTVYRCFTGMASPDELAQGRELLG